MHAELNSLLRFDDKLPAFCVEHRAVINSAVFERHFSNCERVIGRVYVNPRLLCRIADESHFIAILQPFHGVLVLDFLQLAAESGRRAFFGIQRNDI